MPITEDIMDHEIIGRERKLGMKIGREMARQEAREEGQRLLILGMIERHFGPVAAPVRARIESLTGPDIEATAYRLLKADSLADLF